ncbi:hypothetical protein ACDL92_10985 [Ihubacter sp. mB4P-1]|uniref:hypothetical protein n=1 Tax=Ihubacter sp. mB4P-1 TaxID=3242370 RepID=UPI0013797A94
MSLVVNSGGGSGTKIKNAEERRVMNSTDYPIEANTFVQIEPDINVDNGIEVTLQNTIELLKIPLDDNRVLIVFSYKGSYGIYAFIVKNTNGVLTKSEITKIHDTGTTDSAYQENTYAISDTGDVMTFIKTARYTYLFIPFHVNDIDVTPYQPIISRYIANCTCKIIHAGNAFISALIYKENENKPYFLDVLKFVKQDSETFVEYNQGATQYSFNTYIEYQEVFTQCGVHTLLAFRESSTRIAIRTVDTTTSSRIIAKTLDITPVNSSIFLVSMNDDTAILGGYDANYIRELHQIRVDSDGNLSTIKNIKNIKIDTGLDEVALIPWYSKGLDANHVLIVLHFVGRRGRAQKMFVLSLDDGGMLTTPAITTTRGVDYNGLESYDTSLHEYRPNIYTLYLKEIYSALRIEISDDYSITTELIKSSSMNNVAAVTDLDDSELIISDTMGKLFTVSKETSQDIETNKYYSYRAIPACRTIVSEYSSTGWKFKPLYLNLTTGKFKYYVKPYEDLIYGVTKKRIPAAAEGTVYIPTPMPEATAYGLSYSMVDRVVDDIKEGVTNDN